jgi:hypothetical protein
MLLVLMITKKITPYPINIQMVRQTIYFHSDLLEHSLPNKTLFTHDVFEICHSWSGYQLRFRHWSLVSSLVLAIREKFPVFSVCVVAATAFSTRLLVHQN